MNVGKMTATIATVLGLTLLASNSARAADGSDDGAYDDNVALTTVTKVGYRAGASDISLTVAGTDSNGNSVTLSLKNSYSTDGALTLLIEDCNKKASLAMASPTKFSFGFQFDEFGTGSTSATYSTNTSSNSYSVVRTSTRYFYEVECYLTPVSGG